MGASAATSDPSRPATLASSTSKPKSAGANNQSLTSRELEFFVAQIHQSASIQTERIQAVVDGAILAVEQVQDKRIDLLEVGPEVSISDAVFDIFLGLCTFGVGKILVPISTRIVTELIQSASYYGQVKADGKVAGLSKALRYIALAADQKFKQKYTFDTLDVKDIKKYNEYIRQILVQTGEDIATNATQQAISAMPKIMQKGLGVKQVDLQYTDTPGVALLTAAQAYASNQRAVIAVQHAGFEAVVRSSPDHKTLELVKTAITWSALDEDCIAIRDNHKIFFESVIWALLFNMVDSIDKITSRNGVSIPGIEPLLVEYWNRRFAGLIEEWLRSMLKENDNNPRLVAFRKHINLDEVLSQDNTLPQIKPGAFQAAKSQYWKNATIFRFLTTVATELRELFTQHNIDRQTWTVTLAPKGKK